MKTTRHGSLLQAATLAGLTVALTLGTAQAEPTIHASARAETRAPGRRHHVRMAGELAAIFAIGNRWYWRDNGEPNRVDWQLPFDSRALSAKLGSTEGWRFDGNPYDINAVGHPAFGMLTHFLARQNGYGLGESFAISTLASGTWEVALEWAEYGSLNDMAVTSTAGVPLGESAYQLLHHLREARFDVHAGAGSDNGAPFATVGARADLDLLPTTGHGSFRAGQRVSFAADVPTDAAGVRAVDVEATATLAGTYHNTATSQRVLALASSFAYRKQADRPERAWDLLTSVRVGPSIAYSVRHGDVTVDLGADVTVDFAMLKAEGFASWRAAHPTEVMRNVMDGRAQPYYYAVGASADPRIQVGYRGFVAGAKLTGRMFSSIDGADRDQEMITRSVHFTDDETAAETRLGYTLGDLSLQVDGRLHRRGGRADEVSASARERTAMVTVAMRR